jgi:hypothetical protein
VDAWWAGGVRRAVVDARRCFRLAWVPVSLLAWPQVAPAGCPAVLVDPAHAMRVAALRRDNRRGGRATAGKTVFPSPLFPLRYLENIESVIAKHRYCEVVRFVLYSRSLIERLRSDGLPPYARLCLACMPILGETQRPALDLMGLDAVFWPPEVAVRNDGWDRLVSAISGWTQRQ